MGRVEQFEPGPYVSRSRDCSALGCMKSTREGKPFCPVHVEMHPYVKGIVAIRDLRETEIEGIAKGRQVDEKSPLFEEILTHIKNYGPKTAERLARDLIISVPVIKKLVTRMRRSGIIKTGRTNRGSTVVRLP